MNSGRFLLKPFLGKRQFQTIFKTMYKVGLAGMNVGEGGSPDQSGESWVLNFVRSRVMEGTDAPVVFDVGANVGQFAFRLLNTFGPAVKLWSFEPCRSSFLSLQRDLSSRPNVILVNAAVGSKVGEVEMFSPAEKSKLASLYDRTSTWEGARREAVAATTIDGYCAQFGIRKVHFLKIDVEGHELEVLRGAKGMLDSNGIDFIQFEFSAAHIDARVFFRDFFDLLKSRYEIYRVLQNGLAEVKEYNPELELFKRATNYLAVRRT
jgi:FkbM family methyltransferase